MFVADNWRKSMKWKYHVHRYFYRLQYCHSCDFIMDTFTCVFLDAIVFSMYDYWWCLKCPTCGQLCWSYSVILLLLWWANRTMPDSIHLTYICLCVQSYVAKHIVQNCILLLVYLYVNEVRDLIWAIHIIINEDHSSQIVDKHVCAVMQKFYNLFCFLLLMICCYVYLVYKLQFFLTDLTLFCWNFFPGL